MTPDNKQPIKIKTVAELTALYNEWNPGKIKDMSNFVLSTDFDFDILWTKLHGVSSLIQILIDIATQKYNTQQRADLFNRFIDGLKEYYKLWRSGQIQTTGFSHAAYNTQSYEFEYLINTYGPRLNLSGLLGNSATYSKRITPDNQVLAESLLAYGLSGTNPWGDINVYNFSGARFTEQDLIQGIINEYPTGSAARKTLQEKFNIDFGTKKPEQDIKKFFPNAKNPKLLYDLRNGRVPAKEAIYKLPESDFQYIVPNMDLKTASASDIYEIMSKSGKNWSEFQIHSMMSLLIDKSHATQEYLDEILQIIYANKKIFDPANKANFDLFTKLKTKFGDLIDSTLHDARDLSREAKYIESILPERFNKITQIQNAIYTLEQDTKTYNSFTERSIHIGNFHDTKDYFYENAYKIRRTLDTWYRTGKFTQLEQPKKPWAIFASNKEKQAYKELIDLINEINKYIEQSTEHRMQIFGMHEFETTDKKHQYQELLRIEQTSAKNHNERLQDIKADNFEQHIKTSEYTLDTTKAQENTRYERMQKARKTLIQRDPTFGQKSGVVLNEQEIKKREFEQEIEQKIALLRKQPAFRDKSDTHLREKAMIIIQQEQNIKKSR